MRLWSISALVCILLCAAWPASVTSQDLLDRPPASLSSESTAAEQDAALEAMTARLQEDFAAARGPALDWIEDDSLPLDLRSGLLRAAIAAARAAAELDFHDQANAAFLNLTEQLAGGSERSRLFQAWGDLGISRNQFAQAESLYRRADDEAGARGRDEQANLKTSLGVALAQQGQLDEALAAMLQSFRLYEQTDDGPSADLLRNIGGLSIYLQDYDQAVTFSRLALDKLGRDHPRALGIYSNLAAAQIEQGETEAALETLQSAMALSESLGQPNASVISNLGYLLRELDRPDEALAHFEQAAELNRAAGDTGSLAISLKNIGETLIRLDRRAEADTVLQNSLAAYREADIKPKRLELYPVMVDNLEQLGRFEQALALMREYRSLTAELSSADAQARIAELQAAFDLERRERELAESERERLAREAELVALQAEQGRQAMVRWGLLGGLLVLGLFLMVLLRSLRVRNRANRLLADKNAEIEAQREALSENNLRLHRHSVEDELTGLGNRRAVRQLLHGALPETLKTGRVLLVLIDLDRFKGINDRYGHAVGDRVLSRFASLLEAAAGPNDVVARWGGEEFLWLIADAEPDQASHHCKTLAERLQAAEFYAEDRRLVITCSMGVASLDLASKDPQSAFDLALKVADAALYEAKNAGRDSWSGFERRSDDVETFRGSLDVEALISQGSLTRISHGKR